MQPKLAVIMLTYNSAKHLPVFFQCMAKQTYKQYTLFIVDNHSDDNSLALTEQQDLPIVLIKNETNVGFAKGNNQAIAKALEADYEFILLLNNDIECDEFLFEKMIQHLTTSKEHQLLSPKILFYPQTEYIWYAGCNFNKYKGNNTIIRGLYEIDNGQYNTSETTDFAPACCLLFHRKVLETVGLFDEKYFAYYEDADLLYRINKQSNYKLLYSPDIKMYHKVGGSFNARQDLKNVNQFTFGNLYIHLTTRNFVYYLLKQKSVWSYCYLFVFFFRMQMRFFLSGKYKVNFQTYLLLLKSYFEGFSL